jgi:5-formyltetrahydrofolate cyclo-ligase
MAGNFFDSKAAARLYFESARRALSTEETQARSWHAQHHLMGTRYFGQAHCIALYAAQPFEVSTTLLFAEALSQHKQVVFPRVSEGQLVFGAVQSGEQLSVGFKGLLEPSPSCTVVPIERIELWVVPVVSFTVDGVRLGRGKGFYDRALAVTAATKLGLAFEVSRAHHLPTEPHDVKMDGIATERRFYDVTH